MIDIRTERINCAWAQWGVLGPRIVRSTKIAGNVLSEQVAAIIPIKFVFRWTRHKKLPILKIFPIFLIYIMLMWGKLSSCPCFSLLQTVKAGQGHATEWGQLCCWLSLALAFIIQRKWLLQKTPSIWWPKRIPKYTRFALAFLKLIQVGLVGVILTSVIELYYIMHTWT